MGLGSFKPRRTKHKYDESIKRRERITKSNETNRLEGKDEWGNPKTCHCN